MTEPAVRIKARIRMLPTEEGGKTVPISGRYRPNHNLLGPNNGETAMGEIGFPPGSALPPGGTMELEMTLYPWPADVVISPGFEWRIQEASRLVGFGTVLEILDDNRSESS